MKKGLILLVLSSILVFSLSAVSVETIYYASSSLLSSMAAARSLSTEGSDDDIRKRLYDYYGYTEYTVPQEESSEEVIGEGESSYTISINSASSVESSASVFTVTGSVVIDFTSGDTPKRTLSASTVIVDTEKKILTALGNSKYTDSDEDAAIKEIEADILTVSWDNMDILITDGSTQTERENSEKKKVTFSTSGERLTYLSEGSVIFDDGMITSNPKHAYSSISASSILILPGQDMFLSSATFNIGRVPIFYLPFFFFPGSRILGNPSFGFTSTKGAFLNTTFELIGSYPKIETTDESSSFSSLLKTTSDASDESVNGYYYSETDELTGIQKFAKNTSSYLTLMADFYRGGADATELPSGGIHLGVDSVFNLFDRKLKISVFTGVATPKNTTDKTLRYYGNNSLSFSSWGLSLSLKFPYYSDRTVLYNYSNRLTGFSYGPLLGEESKFPTDYSSSGISSFTRSFSLTYSLPSSVKIPLVSSFSLKNLSIEGNYSIVDKSSSSATLRQESNSLLTSYTLPSLSLSLSGNILSLSTSAQSSSSNTVSAAEETTETAEEKDIMEEKLLQGRYTTSIGKTETASVTASKLNLSYTLTEDLSDRTDNNTTTNEKKSEKLSSTTYTRITLEGNVSDIVTVSDVFTYSHVYTQSTDYSQSSWSKKTTTSPLNTLKVSVPLFGVTYNLSFKPFDYSEEETDRKDKTVTSKNFEFTKDYVKTHSLVFSKSFETEAGRFTGELTYIIPPLDSSLTPLVRWSKSGVTLSLYMLFKENDGVFEHDNVRFTAGYSSSCVVFSSTFDYQTKGIESVTDYLEPLSLTSSLRLKTKDGKYYVEESVEGDGETEGFFTTLKTTLKLSDVTAAAVFSRNGEKMELESINIRSSISGKSFQLWKGRIYCSFGLDSVLFLNHRDRTKSYLTFSPSVTFSIAEFIDVKFSFRTQNNRLGSYYENDSFSPRLLWEDALRSVDFFGDGRYNTSFILQSVSLELVHYMEDWNLNFKYTTSFSKGNADGKTVYTLQPSISVYLSWNTMPDLKAEENWTMDASGKWTRK